MGCGTWDQLVASRNQSSDTEDTEDKRDMDSWGDADHDGNIGDSVEVDEDEDEHEHEDEDMNREEEEDNSYGCKLADLFSEASDVEDDDGECDSEHSNESSF